MRHCLAWSPRRAEGGVLLHAMIVLSVVTMLTLLVLGRAQRTVQASRALEHRVDDQVALDSALDAMVYRLLEPSSGVRWLERPGQAQPVGADAPGVQVRITDVAGLIDLNRARASLLDAALADLRLPRQGGLATLRPFSSYAELAGQLQLSAQALACLLERTTLFSGLEAPHPLHSPLAVQRLTGDLARPGALASAIEERPGVVGRTLRLVLWRESAAARSENLQVEIYLTGRSQPAYLLRSMHWVPAVACPA